MALDDFPFTPAVKARPFSWPALPSVKDLKREPLEASLSRLLVLGDEQAVVSLSRKQGEENRETGIGLKREHETVRISCAREALDRLVDLLAPDAVFPDGLSPETQVLVIEHAFSGYISAFERLMGEALEISSKFPDGVADYEVVVSSKRLGKQVFSLRCSSDFILKIEKVFDWSVEKVNQISPMDSALQIPISLCGPEIQLAPKSLTDLSAGDTLLFPHDRSILLPRYISCEGHQLCGVTSKRERLIVSGNLEFSSIKGEYSMQDSEKGNIDRMPVTVQLELSRKHMKIGDLRTLTKGSILPFDTALPDVVRLLVGEKCFAEGQLMQVDDNIAVRITKIA